MSKTIAVTGATGAQGGSVARVLLEAGWKVRAVTRNTQSDAAKKLASQGAEVVQASFDDESSLQNAFEGVNAIFAVTNFWEHLFTGKSQDESGEIEQKQALALAKAADGVKSLEHYVWSTLASAKQSSNGKHSVPHMDYKAEIDEVIRQQYPNLAKKTTYLIVGYYPQNMAFFPFLRPMEWPGSAGCHIQIMPAPPKDSIISAGDMNVTPGIWTKAILEQPEKTHAKYVILATDTPTWQQYLDIWGEVTGKRTSYIECSLGDFVKIWGIGGQELGQQLQWGSTVKDWFKLSPLPQLGPEDLGIKTQGIDTKASLEKLHSAGLLV